MTEINLLLWRIAQWVALAALLSFPPPALADEPAHSSEEHGSMGGMPGMNMGEDEMGMGPMQGMYGPYLMSREASGTSWQPESTPVEGAQLMAGNWMWMFHGIVNGIYDHQSGPRGGTKWFSNSMGMAMGQRPLGPGTLGLRAMLSLDPLMGKRGYPLLLQTGETADGRTPLVDRQHPHDLFMELAGSYSVPLSERDSVFVYFGNPGEPALGPPAFMHRFSGEDNPQAPLTHHWLDSTHITYGVGTTGVVLDQWKIEASVFNGREPDQNRWNINSPKFDSASGRVTFNPSANWSLQASYGYLKSPEQLAPATHERRVTASAIYNLPFGDNNWATTFAWGRKMESPGDDLDGFLLESAINLAETHTIFGRIERTDEDELFQPPSPLAGRSFAVNEFSLGYIYDIPVVEHLKLGIGGVSTLDVLPSEMRAAYGGRTPLSFMAFMRLKLL
ncbi:MAG TPA: hypothetical protein VN766_11520 [Stellaceae bacterium]|jgi:hypothetical protein|nr:hypothetical protein [Stellaceae bacterium]